MRKIFAPNYDKITATPQMCNHMGSRNKRITFQMFLCFPLAIDAYVDQFMNLGNTLFMKFNRIGVH